MRLSLMQGTAHRAALDYLDTCDGNTFPSAVDIAHAVKMKPQSLTSAMTRLHQEQFVQRRYVNTGRSAHYEYRITAAGRVALRTGPDLARGEWH